MLPVIAIILVLLWGLGMLASFTFGGYIHVLVLAAVALLLIRIIREPAPRRPLHPASRRPWS